MGRNPSNSVCCGPVCSSSMISSLFSFARATWRGAVAVSDIDRMDSSNQLQCFARITSLGQLAGFLMVLSMHCEMQKSEAAKL